MPLDFDEPLKRDRDRRLRRKLLDVLYLSRGAPLGGLNGRPLVIATDNSMAPGLHLEDDRHAMDLIRDLENKGLVTVERKMRPRGTSFGPDHIVVKITDRGSQLCREAIDPDPDVHDQRVRAEE